ncbi:MAG TPA: hypothetical protein VHV78_13495, partial [Gemmatimonadaceae bacterium]|nr:hypothetical protein [Gemmatimonadaceae bacterium]
MNLIFSNSLRDGRMRRTVTLAALAALTIPLTMFGQANARCAPDNAGVKLPPGFCAEIYADSIPGVRHMVFAPNGDLFVSRQGRGGGVMALRETNHSGHPDVRRQIATGYTTSEVALFDGYLYTEARPMGGGRGAPAPVIAILRYPMKPGDLTPTGPPDTIVAGLPGGGNHTTRNFAITSAGVMYVNLGSATNSCQETDRTKGSVGKNPCAELDTRAGVWMFDARKKNQMQGTAVHFAKGIRNAVGIAISPLD